MPRPGRDREPGGHRRSMDGATLRASIRHSLHPDVAAGEHQPRRPHQPQLPHLPHHRQTSLRPPHLPAALPLLRLRLAIPTIPAPGADTPSPASDAPTGPPPATAAGPAAARRRAQTVGECKTCADAAEFEARLQRRMRERGRQDTGSSAATTSTMNSNVAVAGSDRRSAAATIKSMIPGLKRSSVGPTVRTTTVEEVEERHRHRYSRRHSRVPCTPPQYVTRQMSRRLTPPPGYSRRLSI